MQKAKAKRTSRWQTSPFLYALVWAVGIAGVSAVTRALENALVLRMTPDQLTGHQFDLIGIFLPTLLMGMIPVLLTERLLKRSMRNWLIYTLLGTLVMTLWSGLFPWNSRLPLVVFLSSVSFLWPLMFQMAWLWRRVKRAWLWPVANVAVGQIFRLVFPQGLPFSSPLITPIILVTNFVCALVMYYLWTHAKDTAKAKVDVNEAEIMRSDEARIQRLQEADERRAPWDFGDQQALYNEA